jgi:hypothetical protein
MKGALLFITLCWIFKANYGVIIVKAGQEGQQLANSTTLFLLTLSTIFNRSALNVT